MITGVSLRQLYLIFDRLLNWLTLLGRTTSSKDIKLVILRHEVAVCADPTPSPPRLGRPSRLRRADAFPRCFASSPGHSGHGPALAPPLGDQEVDLQSGRPPIDDTIAAPVPPADHVGPTRRRRQATIDVTSIKISP
jgi:putative transposase